MNKYNHKSVQYSVLIFGLFLFLSVFQSASAQDSSVVNAISAGYWRWNTAVSVAVQDSYAYVAVGWHGLRVLDISKPDSLKTIGYNDEIGFATNMVVAGDYLFLTTTDSGLAIVDISIPDEPKRVTNFQLDDELNAIILLGNLAYVTGDKGLYVIDITDPHRPQEVSRHQTSEKLQSIVLRGNYAFAANRFSGVCIFDLSVPTAPKKISRIVAKNCSENVALAGGYLYVADGIAGLQIYDVSKPESPKSIGSYNSNGYIRFVAIFGNVAYCYDLIHGLLTVAIESPTAPHFISYSDTKGVVQGMKVSDNRLFLSTLSNGLRILETSRTGTLKEIGSYSTGSNWSDQFSSLFTEKNVFVAEGRAGLLVFARKEPIGVKQIAHLEVAGNIIAVAKLNDDILVLADNYHGYRIIDVSNPSLPKQVGFISRGATGRPIAAIDGRIYVPAQQYHQRGAPENGLDIIDLKDPGVPKQIAFFSTNGYVNGLGSAGKYLYIVTDSGYVSAYDATNPKSPVLIGSSRIGGKGLQIIGDFAFVGSTIVNIADPTHPNEAGWYYNGAAVYGNWVFGKQESYRLEKIYYPDLRALVAQTSAVDPGKCELKQVTPNPFKRYANIEYSLKNHAENYTVELYVEDAAGKEVARLVNYSQHAGVYNVQFDAKGMPDGAYTVKLKLLYNIDAEIKVKKKSV